MSNRIERLQLFVATISRLAEQAATQGQGDVALMNAAVEPLRELVAHDDWLPAEMARPHPDYYQQHLLYCDPLERFSLVSFVWGPGQQTPVHDHTVWGLIGALRGAEIEQRYRSDDGRIVPDGEPEHLPAGGVAAVSPALGDVHRVRNAFDDRVSISIHLYGGNIGRIRRHVFDLTTGAVKPFVSNYSNAFVPNLWAVSAT